MSYPTGGFLPRSKRGVAPHTFGMPAADWKLLLPSHRLLIEAVAKAKDVANVEAVLSFHPEDDLLKDINHEYPDGKSILLKALVFTLTRVVDFLLRCETFTNYDAVCKETKCTALHLCACITTPNIAASLKLLSNDCGFNMYDAVDGKGRTALHWCCAQGAMKEASLALMQKKEFTNFDQVDFRGNTALHYAVDYSDEAVCMAIMESKKFTAFDAACERGYTALHLAVSKGFTDLCLALINVPKFTNVNAATKEEGMTALIMACNNKGTAFKVCTAMIQHKSVDLNIKCKAGMTAFIYAACNGLEDVCMDLLNSDGKFEGDPKKVAQLDVVDESKRTVLHWAAFYRLEKLYHALLSDRRFSQWNAISSFGGTALHYLVLGGINNNPATCKEEHVRKEAPNWESVDALMLIFLRSGRFSAACLNQALYSSNQTILHLASANGLLKTCQFLLDTSNGFTKIDIETKQCQDPPARRKRGNDSFIPMTAFELAKTTEISDLFKMAAPAEFLARLIREGDGPGSLTFLREIKPEEEARENAGQILNDLQKEKCGCISERLPVLHLAIRRGLDEVALTIAQSNLFTQHGTKDKQGRTSLHLAIENGLEDVAMAIVECKSFTQHDAKDHLGRNALHLAAENGLKDVAVAIVECQSFTQHNAKDKQGRTCLHLAIENGLEDVAVAIVECKSFTQHDAMDYLGRNALHLAAENGLGLVAAAIMASPLSKTLHASDKEGRTILYHAATTGLVDLCQMILDDPARPTLSDGAIKVMLEAAIRQGQDEVILLFLEQNLLSSENRKSLSLSNGMVIDLAEKLFFAPGGPGAKAAAHRFTTAADAQMKTEKIESGEIAMAGAQEGENPKKRPLASLTSSDCNAKQSTLNMCKKRKQKTDMPKTEAAHPYFDAVCGYSTRRENFLRKIWGNAWPEANNEKLVAGQAATMLFGQPNDLADPTPKAPILAYREDSNFVYHLLSSNQYSGAHKNGYGTFICGPRSRPVLPTHYANGTTFDEGIFQVANKLLRQHGIKTEHSENGNIFSYFFTSHKGQKLKVSFETIQAKFLETPAASDAHCYTYMIDNRKRLFTALFLDEKPEVSSGDANAEFQRSCFECLVQKQHVRENAVRADARNFLEKHQNAAPTVPLSFSALESDAKVQTRRGKNKEYKTGTLVANASGYGNSSGHCLVSYNSEETYKVSESYVRLAELNETIGLTQQQLQRLLRRAGVVCECDANGIDFFDQIRDVTCNFLKPFIRRQMQLHDMQRGLDSKQTDKQADGATVITVGNVTAAAPRKHSLYGLGSRSGVRYILGPSILGIAAAKGIKMSGEGLSVMHDLLVECLERLLHLTGTEIRDVKLCRPKYSSSTYPVLTGFGPNNIFAEGSTRQVKQEFSSLSVDLLKDQVFRGEHKRFPCTETSGAPEELNTWSIYTKHFLGEAVLQLYPVGLGTRVKNFATNAVGDGKQTMSFPAPLIARVAQVISGHPVRMTEESAKFLAATVEKTCLEILLKCANKLPCIDPRDLALAIRGDIELNSLFQGHIMHGGVLPQLHTDIASNLSPARSSHIIFPRSQSDHIRKGGSDCVHMHAHFGQIVKKEGLVSLEDINKAFTGSQSAFEAKFKKRLKDGHAAIGLGGHFHAWPLLDKAELKEEIEGMKEEKRNESYFNYRSRLSERREIWRDENPGEYMNSDSDDCERRLGSDCMSDSDVDEDAIANDLRTQRHGTMRYASIFEILSPVSIESRREQVFKSLSTEDQKVLESMRAEPVLAFQRRVHDIHLEQRSTTKILNTDVFSRVVLQVAHDIKQEQNAEGRSLATAAQAKPNGKIAFTHEAIIATQLITEAFLVRLFQDAHLICVHEGRFVVLPQDLELAQRMRGELRREGVEGGPFVYE